jgi:heme-degrading monooxygenase HmoA
MIKGIIGYKVSSYMEVGPILMKLRAHAMRYPGFIYAENLVSEEDSSVVVMISTWETIQNWKTWVESGKTQELFRQAREIVMGTARITAYRAMPTVKWR